MGISGATPLTWSHTVSPSLHLPPPLFVSFHSTSSMFDLLFFPFLHLLLFSINVALLTHPFHFTRAGRLGGSGFAVALIKHPRYILKFVFSNSFLSLLHHVKLFYSLFYAFVAVGDKITIVSWTGLGISWTVLKLLSMFQLSNSLASFSWSASLGWIN